MSMHAKMTMGQAHARRRSQSEGIRFIICFGRQSNKPPSGLADRGLDQNARRELVNPCRVPFDVLALSMTPEASAQALRSSGGAGNASQPCRPDSSAVIAGIDPAIHLLRKTARIEIRV
jgi:hypothetical protein